MEYLPFTLLEIDDPVWTLETMLCTIHSTNTSRGIALGELRMGLVYSVETRPASVDLRRRVSGTELVILVHTPLR